MAFENGKMETKYNYWRCQDKVCEITQKSPKIVVDFLKTMCYHYTDIIFL